jgi:hypothetical protein
MKIIYTIHARLRMSLRGITEKMVEETMSKPEREGVGYRNKRVAFKSFGQKSIKVVYAIDNNEVIIITVMWE